MKRMSITEFVSANSELVDSVFVKKSHKTAYKRKLISLFYLLKLFMFRIWVAIF